MKHVRLLFSTLTLIVILLLNSCSPSIKTAASWTNKEKLQPPYKSIFILVLTQNMETKAILENELATAAAAKGIKAYKSLDVFGPISTKESLPVKEALRKKITDLGCAAIFTVALVDQKSETRYVPGSSYTYSPYSNFGYYGMFGSYYSYSSSMYSPGYYSTNNTYFIESNLYNATTEELLLSIQSKAENPPAIQKSSKLYTETLIEEIQSLGLLKK